MSLTITEVNGETAVYDPTLNTDQTFKDGLEYEVT